MHALYLCRKAWDTIAHIYLFLHLLSLITTTHYGKVDSCAVVDELYGRVIRRN
jgi:hypothetical protein